MKNFLVILSFISMTAFAAVERRSLDFKMPSQQMVERQIIASPGASNTSAVVSGTAGNTSAAAATLSTFTGQPDVPRVISILPGGVTADVAACDIVVTGTNINGGTISETFSFANNQAVIRIGTKAFKTVTSVAFPANCEDGSFGATWSIGYGFALGLKKCMRNTGNFMHATYAGIYEATRPTITYGSSQVEANTIKLSTTLAGQDVEAFFMQNYQCNP